MADLSKWDPTRAASYEEQKERSLDLFKLLAEEYDATGELEKLVNAGKRPPGALGVKAAALAKGLDVQWVRQVTAALVEDQVVDENRFTSDQALKALTTWITEVLGG